MATTTFSVAENQTTDALFRSWVSGFITALTTVGIVQTSDTGQINTATVTRPTSNNQIKGYAMFRFADSLQATAPFFFKFEFGCASVDEPKIWYTFGTATDGAGNLTGLQKTTQATVNAGSGNSTTPAPCYCSGDTNRFAICMWDSQESFFFACERSKNIDGTDSGSAMIYSAQDSRNNVSRSEYLPVAGVWPGLEGDLRGPYTANFLVGTSVGLFPSYPMYGAPQNPFLNFLTYRSGSITTLTVFTVTYYGATHTFLTLANVRGNMRATDGNNRLAMRWE